MAASRQLLHPIEIALYPHRIAFHRFPRLVERGEVISIDENSRSEKRRPEEGLARAGDAKVVARMRFPFPEYSLMTPGA